MLVNPARNALDLLASPVIQERAARVRAHRPWPAPDRSWVMAQSWIDLLFAHWRVPATALRKAVPPQLELDTFDRAGWIGVTPFEVRNLRLRPTLPVPFLSAFPEINVRTYVTLGGKPGIFFFSLDAASTLAVAAARRSYRLPYFRASISIARVGGVVRYASERSAREYAPPAQFRASYQPVGAAYSAAAGTLEHWLTERYCLYTLDEQHRVLRAEIQHPPWPLQPAEAEITLNTMADETGLELSGEPLLHYARRQDVAFWTLERAEEADC
jgi:uncharacterized protein YqjF (DUF2071 family)